MVLRIVALRRAAGLTQEKLAERLGVSHAMVQRWESGRATAFEAKLRAMASALGCRPGDLFEAEPPERQSVAEARKEAATLISRMTARQRAAWLALARAMLEPTGT